MRRPFRKAIRVLAPLALTVALGGSAYAYMASNVEPTTSAGSGSGVVSGYIVQGITYALTMAPGDPGDLLNVAFSLTPASGDLPAQAVAVWFDSDTSHVASKQLTTCEEIGGPTSAGVTYWTCSLDMWDQQAGPAPTATALHVAAVH
jgi:hypothetical protein